MRIICDIREMKKKPKLGEVLQIYNKNLGKPGAKEEFQNKLFRLYG